ncbi:MAG: phage holin [Burkholderiales bacterium]
MIQKRWKSKVLWMSIIAQVIALLSVFGLWEWIGVTEEWVNKVVVIVMGILTTLGIVNNPTDPNSL